MSISFSCPHCGKQTVVADQFAGQTGPCSGCSKPITIPATSSLPGYTSGPPAKKGGGAMLWVAIILGVGFGGLFCCGILTALLLPAVQASREAARRMQSSNNLKQLALALHNYADTHGTLPPAVVTDENGKPLYSGRVLLLPFMEQSALYDQFDKSKAWDSPENMGLSQSSIKAFLDPSNPNNNPTRSDYVFVTGPGTAFEGNKSAKFMDITDGLSNTLGFVETTSGPSSWAEPLEYDASAGPIARGSHPGGPLVAYLDGSVRLIPTQAAQQHSQALSTRSGGEVMPDF
ncbi:DUF1559 domain-containing protein [Anatilimnocola sp. NA78]|uniref:DUF1559 domain-containing protein n=1 Tax=Anatilimnocola sp. NA78 TaxID=3415683 RepID=UPI003CE475D0